MMLTIRRLERKMLMEVRREGRITIPTRRMMLMNMERRNRRFRRLDKLPNIIMSEKLTVCTNTNIY